MDVGEGDVAEGTLVEEGDAVAVWVGVEVEAGDGVVAQAIKPVSITRTLKIESSLPNQESNLFIFSSSNLPLSIPVFSFINLFKLKCFQSSQRLGSGLT